MSHGMRNSSGMQAINAALRCTCASAAGPRPVDVWSTKRPGLAPAITDLVAGTVLHQRPSNSKQVHALVAHCSTSIYFHAYFITGDCDPPSNAIERGGYCRKRPSHPRRCRGVKAEFQGRWARCWCPFAARR